VRVLLDNCVPWRLGEALLQALNEVRQGEVREIGG
jgi:hypothetical protein